jgi:hypothetical protein
VINPNRRHIFSVLFIPVGILVWFWRKVLAVLWMQNFSRGDSGDVAAPRQSIVIVFALAA